MKLISDFTDWYDFAFDYFSPLIFRRVTTDYHSSRHEDLCFMKNKLQLLTVEFDTVASLIYKDVYDMVVYDNEFAHRGEGKRLVNLTTVQTADMDKLATEYLRYKPRTSYRWLRLGANLQFWLKYTSADDWRSNAGTDGTVEVWEDRGDLTPATQQIDWIMGNNIRQGFIPPLAAVDFVAGSPYHLYAVDWNPAPSCRGAGLENHVSAKQIVESIKNAVEH